MKRLTTITICLLIAIIAQAQTYRLRLAKAYIEQGNYKEAAMELRPLAENGNAEAQYMAGRLFEEGLGVIKSNDQADKYYTLAAQQGHADAALSVYKLRMKTKGENAGYAILKQACTTFPDFMKTNLGHELGFLTYEGCGVEANKEKGWEMMWESYATLLKNKETTYMDSLSTYYYPYIIEKYGQTPKVLLQKFNAGTPDWIFKNMPALEAKAHEDWDLNDEYIREAQADHGFAGTILSMVLFNSSKNWALKEQPDLADAYAGVLVAMLTEAGYNVAKVNAGEYSALIQHAAKTPGKKVRPQAIDPVEERKRENERMNDMFNVIDSDDENLPDRLNPEFPGGAEAMNKWIAENLRYPMIAHENGIQGRVTVAFTVEKDGSITDVTVDRGVDPSIDKEAVRLVKAMPKFLPAVVNGKRISVKMKTSILFRLK